MPIYNFKCCKCPRELRIFLRMEDSQKIQECTCGYTMKKQLNIFSFKNENPPFQTSEDCIEDSKEEVLKELESFKEEYKNWKF